MAGPIKVAAHVAGGHFVRASTRAARTTRAYAVTASAYRATLTGPTSSWSAFSSVGNGRRGTQRTITRYMGGARKTLTLSRMRARPAMSGPFKRPLSYPTTVTVTRSSGVPRTYRPTRSSVGRVQRLFGPQAARRTRFGGI